MVAKLPSATRNMYVDGESSFYIPPPSLENMADYEKKNGAEWRAERWDWEIDDVGANDPGAKARTH
jgi:hypothetical protein